MVRLKVVFGCTVSVNDSVQTCVIVANLDSKLVIPVSCLSWAYCLKYWYYSFTVSIALVCIMVNINYHYKI